MDSVDHALVLLTGLDELTSEVSHSQPSNLNLSFSGSGQMLVLELEKKRATADDKKWAPDRDSTDRIDWQI